MARAPPTTCSSVVPTLAQTAASESASPAAGMDGNAALPTGTLGSSPSTVSRVKLLANRFETSEPQSPQRELKPKTRAASFAERGAAAAQRAPERAEGSPPSAPAPQKEALRAEISTQGDAAPEPAATKAAPEPAPAEAPPLPLFAKPAPEVVATEPEDSEARAGSEDAMSSVTAVGDSCSPELSAAASVSKTSCRSSSASTASSSSALAEPGAHELLPSPHMEPHDVEEQSQQISVRSSFSVRIVYRGKAEGAPAAPCAIGYVGFFGKAG